VTEPVIQSLPIAVAIVERDGQYLIGQRPPDVPQGGFWEFPGGKIKPGESAGQAAVRECTEETGLQVEATGCLGVVQHQYAETPSSNPPREAYWVNVSFIACRLTSGSPTAIPPFQWVAAGELANYRFPAANTSVIQRILREAQEIA
jgi:8-oxo-dGTP diphosphatase